MINLHFVLSDFQLDLIFQDFFNRFSVSQQGNFARIWNKDLSKNSNN